MGRWPEIVLLVVVALFLGAWTWFWTGPELEWERNLYTSGAASLPHSASAEVHEPNSLPQPSAEGE